MGSKRSSSPPSRPRAAPRRPMRYAPMRSGSPERCAGSSAEIRLVHHVLTLVIGLLPEHLARCVAEMGAVRARLDTDTALRALRLLTAAQLPALPAPLGFYPHRLDAGNRNRALQHNMGPDPPPPCA